MSKAAQDSYFWHLSDQEHQFIKQYRGVNRLKCAALLKYYQIEGRLPEKFSDIPDVGRRILSKSLKVPDDVDPDYDYMDRTGKRLRQTIRDLLKIRNSLPEDWDTVQSDLVDVCFHDFDAENALPQLLKQWFQDRGIERPTVLREERILNAVRVSLEERRYQYITDQISDACKQGLDDLLKTQTGETSAPLVLLKDDPGKPCLSSVFVELSKLESIDKLSLSLDLFPADWHKLRKTYRHRATREPVRELRRHPDHVRYSLLAALCLERREEILDNLTDLLIQIVHKIQVKAERRVTKEIAGGVREVSAKKALLFKIAQTAIENPDATIRDALFPIIGENTFNDLVKEFEASSPFYNEQVELVARNSYKSHYRRMVPPILEVLKFRCNNQHHRPVIDAITILKSLKFGQRVLQADVLPISGIVPKSLQSLLIEDGKINRISYEICVLRALRNALRCREIWVEGARRYRNPDEDVPQDFEEKRIAYYEGLSLPMRSNDFITVLQSRMEKVLRTLNSGLYKNDKVFIRLHGKNLIKVSPLEPQAEPAFLKHLKSQVMMQWPMTSLLDVLKEADCQIGFTNLLKSYGDREILSRDVLQKRLLLCLYALGTNTGLKRVLAGGADVTLDELRYVKERYVHKDGLKAAIAKIVNATLEVRQSQIWGEGTTSCASDSKKLHAWDQNLMSEWHVRYKGRGVMVYWHVEKNSLCVHSQLKRCSSSEVSSMIEGVLRHCTDMEIDKQYVDSHGQSEVAFAFCELLGFSLMPRLKAIAQQKLYLPDNDMRSELHNLAPVLKKHPINWEMIAQQYDQMVKFATALQKGTASAESILNRFTRNNRQHPTYQALAELGRAVKTIFLCEYLHSEDIRREIHEALNVVENCNSTVDFIFFARGNEISSNQLEAQELSILSLHLLQVCLVYVNTIMIQQVLAEPKMMGKMRKEDFRALTPLIYGHITPYGSFDLDMERRLFPENDNLLMAA